MNKEKNIVQKFREKFIPNKEGDSKSKKSLKQMGFWVIVFFSVKGIISLTLIILGIKCVTG